MWCHESEMLLGRSSLVVSTLRSRRDSGWATTTVSFLAWPLLTRAGGEPFRLAVALVDAPKKRHKQLERTLTFQAHPLGRL